MRFRRLGRKAIVAASLLVGCGGSALDGALPADAGAIDRALSDAGVGHDASVLDGAAETSCVPGRAMACVGPGGCSTNQVCNASGTGFGECECASTETGAAVCVPGQSIACVGSGGCSTNQVCKADGTGYEACTCAADAGPSTACVPGQSTACAGPGGCISSQACKVDGTGYDPCVCANDGGASLLCIPGQSIACAGPYACPSFQVCDEAGQSYGACACPDSGVTYVNDAGAYPDGYAHLPPPVGQQGYNAIWSPSSPKYLFVPLFSAPDCTVIPPYGVSYVIEFVPAGAGPNGTLPACPTDTAPSAPCYSEQRTSLPPDSYKDYGALPGGVYTLSQFDSNGIATGQVSTREGIVPLVVKRCP